MIIRKLLLKAIDELKEENIEESILKAKLLLAFVLDKTKEDIMINSEEEVEIIQEKKYMALIKKLIQNIPLQYITNNQEFMGLNFYVDENVLIPRADTETLVEEVLKIAEGEKEQNILDMCTGSGAIAVSIAKNMLNANITAVDVSSKALKIAQKNAVKNQVDDKIKFLESNMFKKVSGKFDIIVSNPPYIEKETIKTLTKEVKNEPLIALDGGKSGLDFYEILAKEAKNYLNENGLLCMEIGYNQKESVIELLNDYNNVRCIQDLGCNDRVIICNI